MSKKIDEMRAHLHTQLDAIVDHLGAAKATLEAAPRQVEADIRANLELAKAKVQAKKQEVEAAKARIQQLAEEKKGELESQVAEWKAQREHAKLAARAERAEVYAEACIAVALAAANEANEAVLEAVAARMDADPAAP